MNKTVQGTARLYIISLPQVVWSEGMLLGSCWSLQYFLSNKTKDSALVQTVAFSISEAVCLGYSPVPNKGSYLNNHTYQNFAQKLSNVPTQIRIPIENLPNYSMPLYLLTCQSVINGLWSLNLLKN